MTAATRKREPLLSAGALLPLDADGDSHAPLDPVRARRYHHPALGGRTVVRLAGETVAVAEDRLLVFLGFDQVEVGEPLARTLRRGLGYVEWVLANDLDHADAALAAAPEVEGAARLAPSRPRAAIRLFEGVASRLPTAHLPALWEHAGRAFLAGAGDNRRRWAAAMFERAREAESVHGLRVDRATRDEAYREFAFAGALRTGAVARHVADLRRRRGTPEAAYRALCELVSGCTTSGMPPWAALPDQVRRLAGAASRQPDAEAERLLAELLALPATRLASAGFWRRCRPTLIRMGRASAEVRRTLLELFPAPRNGRGGFDGWWLDLLDEAGALDALTLPADRVPPEAAPRPGAAGWLDRFLRHSRGRWGEPGPPAQLFALLPRMAERLAADGDAVAPRVERDGRGIIDANVVDACLEHGIPLADPAEGDAIDLAEWAASAGGGTRRDLVFAAADPRFERLLLAAIRDCWRRPGLHPDDLLAVQGLSPLVGRALEDRVAALSQGGLARAADLLDELAETTSRRAFARVPAAHTGLADADLAAPLARTLRAGLLDELGWPALEEAVEELGGGQVSYSESWPVLVVHDHVRAIAVGPGGRVAEHELRLTNPSHRSSPTVRYAGGQFLVAWDDEARDQRLAYWSGAANETFPLDEPYWHDGPAHGFALLLPDGGRVAGGRALYPGDRALQPEMHVCWDGETFWVLVPRARRDDRTGLRELDPWTGERGRPSLPGFLADLVPGAGEALAAGLCSLAPLPAGLEGTPLGHRGGLVGFRVAAGRRNGRQVVTIEGVDGRRLAVPDPDPVEPMLLDYHLSLGMGPVGLIALPGGGGPRLLSSGGRFSSTLALWDPEMTGPVARVPIGPVATGPPGWNGWSGGYDREPRLCPSGAPFVPPAAFWHCLVPRDEAGSRALRGVTDELARELLAAALADVAARPEEVATVDMMERTAAAVARLLPAVMHPRLRRGMVGVVRSAAFTQPRLGSLAERRAPVRGASAVAMAMAEEPAARSCARLADDLLSSALVGLGGLHTRDARDLGPGRRTAEQLQLLGRFFDGDLGPEAVEPSLRSGLPWPVMLGRAGAIAFRAACPATNEQDRAVLLDLLELWACLPFSADPASFWTGRLGRWPALAGRSERGAFAVLAEEVTSSVLPDPRPSHGGAIFGAGALFIERRSGKAPALPDQAEPVQARQVTAGWGTPTQLTAFVRLVRERGPVRWDPAVPGTLAASVGLTRAEAALLWAGLPDLDTQEHERDFLGPERRRLLGLSVTEAAAARERLRRLDLDQRYGLLQAAMPEDPALLWTPLEAGPDDGPVARLAAVWVRIVGRLRPVPDGAIGEAVALRDSISERAHGMWWAQRPAISLLQMLLDPAREPALVTDHDCWLRDLHAPLVVESRDGRGAQLGVLFIELAVLLSWAFATRPVGDPVRARLPELLALSRARLAHPGLLLEGPFVSTADDAAQTLRRAFGSRPYRHQGTADSISGETAEDGLTVAVAHHQRSMWLFFRPALLGEQDARSRCLRHWLALDQLDKARTLVSAIDLLRGQGYTAMAERVGSTPVPPGAYEANPASSAPGTVRAVRQALGLGADAAALYLQLLTLLEPTDHKLHRWNGWTAARRRRAGAELAGAGLVLQATRPRSGRHLFLRGEWVPAAAPNLPLEAWKLPLYGIERDRAGASPRGPLPRFLPLAPLHELFAAAWGRIEAGDRPGHHPQGGTA
jgi:hypothetical protein